VAQLDTVIVEPEQSRLILTSRIAIEVGCKIDRLREVTVGQLKPGEERAFLTGKRYFPTAGGNIAEPDENQ
jgi:hypothetical protein